MKGKTITNSKAIQIVGTIIAIPLMVYAVYSNLWAEPETPLKVIPTIVVQTDTAYTELEEDFVVETMEQEEDISEELFYDELEYLACCVEAEAGNQSILGKRLVVDVIFNRVDSPDYPNSITGVINQPGQFCVVDNGSINSVVPSFETWQAITLEMMSRINTDILYFQGGGYTSYGTDWEHVGAHYFSTGK